jgi:hypothetical protein
MRHSITVGLVAALALGLSATPARAQLATPSCPALVKWAEGYDQRAGWRPNEATARPVFAALFAEDSTAALFGKPVLAWTPEEANALGPVLAACASEQQRARNTAVSRALSGLRVQATREVPRYLTALATARRTIPPSLEALGPAEASLPLLAFYLALADVPEGDAMQRANTYAARQPRGPVQDAARAVVAALRDLPQAEMAPAVQPAAAAQIPALRRSLRETLVDEIDAVELSAAGLRVLDRHAQSAARDYAPLLGPEEMRLVEAALAARRGAIGENARDELIRQAGAAALTPQGLQELARLEQHVRQQQANTLGEAGVTAVVAAIETRRGEIGTALRDGIIAQVQAVPPTVQGAQMLDRIAQQTQQQQEPLIGRAGINAVLASIETRRREIGVTVRDGLLTSIAGLPANPETLQMLRGVETQMAPQVAAVLGAEGARAVRQAAAERRAALGAEVGAAIVKEIAGTPVGPEAFQALDRRSDPTLLALLPVEQAGQVRTAAETRRKQITEALLPAFQRELAALPETDESLRRIDAEVLPEIAALPGSAADAKAALSEAATARRAAILAAVNRAEAGSLRGRIYEGPMMKLEFIDRSRVIATVLINPPAAGTYTEESDGRVIVEVNSQSMVFTREGRRLVAGPIAVTRTK